MHRPLPGSVKDVLGSPWDTTFWRSCLSSVARCIYTPDNVGFLPSFLLTPAASLPFLLRKFARCPSLLPLPIFVATLIAVRLPFHHTVDRVRTVEATQKLRLQTFCTRRVRESRPFLSSFWATVNVTTGWLTTQ